MNEIQKFTLSEALRTALSPYGGRVELLVDGSTGVYLLHGEQLGTDESRPLLGKPTPCVGRAQELALLDFTFTSSIEEPGARALLVTAPPGTGKSRLRHEFLRRIERKAPETLVLLGRGDPMSVGATTNLMGQALRRLCGTSEASNLEVRRQRLYQRVSRHVHPSEAQENADFLGELCAIPFPEKQSPRLRAARQDPRLVTMYLAQAEAYLAQDDVGAGESALRQAIRCVYTRASDIPDPTARERFLHQVPENARALELARQRWGDSEPG
ncbi:Adenylate cyclase [Cystobacter fuscus DSM 2262]|uniref:Adenylate cyclase n=1 Tax=Cystobacter fuscus (strain ATCC 25194 / DSM 2262 / NBRC 100088 / M29) TaxID=1242864 RepID=S9PMB2_CYSF2|nr:ATP-binding protein [Cystobacter fuscus]EPX65420.1 Adenylate cyclase [Cystobacter fuscus DSM 2262]